MPTHNHDINTYTGAAGGFIPATTNNAGTLVTRTTGDKGGGGAHNNIQPSTISRYIIKT